MTNRLPTVLISGGSRGIGRAIADALAPDHHLLIGGRNADAVDNVCRSLPSARPFVADLADTDAVTAAVVGVDVVDAVVHSAGVLGSGEVADLRREDWRHTLELNVVAVADLTRLLLPRLRERRGQVVVINSGSGFISRGGGGLYSASKFAVRAFTDALREEERPHGVRVSSIHPGRVATDMQRELRRYEDGEYVASDYLRPESVAAAVRFALTVADDGCVEELSIRPR
ncbi:SDR family oxidoreductase [Rudaeicoccus suwonensis]|nr:SDR family oxidoreductase [Rudaeicoccus suwonensis]